MKLLNNRGEAVFALVALLGVFGLGMGAELKASKAKAKRDLAHQADFYKKQIHYQKYHSELVAKEKAAYRAWQQSQDYKIK